MIISYDQAKRQVTLRMRGLDFEDAAIVFSGPHFTDLDDRIDYGEDRWITIGQLYEQVVVLVWTERDDSRRIISMRKAESDEEREFYEQLAGPG
ncbi:MAG: BrnT family toxin [Sphingomonas sp.]